MWDVISRTDRYAEWVAGAIEVTDHHGVATVGKTYSERNRTLGPLKTDSVWTVREIEPFKRRVDTGTGFAPLQDVTNTFEFRSVQSRWVHLVITLDVLLRSGASRSPSDRRRFLVSGLVDRPVRQTESDRIVSWLMCPRRSAAPN
ncbi:hypothetical protein [Streptomyces ferrugineus]|uniref:hypothetical protein n=1 Tax=Streptomyces ferrugineus TaxID=1413221 RepID=UPI001D154821|nr:hypothetical protein [Streptomyces ferrugineus]